MIMMKVIKKRQTTVRFNDKPVIIEPQKYAAGANDRQQNCLFHNMGRLRAAYKADMDHFERQIAKNYRMGCKNILGSTAANGSSSEGNTTRTVRGLEYHLSINAHRPKFARMYVRAVVQKSLILRSAAFMGRLSRSRSRSKNSSSDNSGNSIDDQLQRFATKHSHANQLIALETARQDQIEALQVLNQADDVEFLQLMLAISLVGNAPGATASERNRKTPSTTTSSSSKSSKSSKSATTTSNKQRILQRNCSLTRRERKGSLFAASA